MKTLWIYKKDAPETMISEDVEVINSGQSNTLRQFGQLAPLSDEPIYLLITAEAISFKRDCRYCVSSNEGKIKFWIDLLEWQSVEHDGKFRLKVAKSKNQSENVTK